MKKLIIFSVLLAGCGDGQGTVEQPNAVEVSVKAGLPSDCKRIINAGCLRAPQTGTQIWLFYETNSGEYRIVHYTKNDFGKSYSVADNIIFAPAESKN